VAPADGEEQQQQLEILPDNDFDFHTSLKRTQIARQEAPNTFWQQAGPYRLKGSEVR
jgi:hypothetical protein